MDFLKPIGLPMHDAALAEHVATYNPDIQIADAPTAPETIAALATQAIVNIEPKKSFLVPSEFSGHVQPFVEAINNAIENGSTTIQGRSLLDYAKDHADYIPAHEKTRFLDKVGRL